jgi:hypothetical protein
MAKTKPNLSVVEPSPLAAINASIETLNFAVGKLRAADAELLKEEIALQQQRSRAPTGDNPLRQAALELLDGPSATEAKPKASRIQEITAERAKIAAALEIAEGRMVRLMFDRANEQRKLLAPEWAEIQRERVMAVLHLQKLNRRAQQMLAGVVDPHGRAEMAGSFPNSSAATFLLGNGSLNAGEAHDFCELNVRNGTVTRAEIEKAKENI